MHQRNIASIENIKPAKSPVDLDVGRIQPREVVHLAGITLASLVVGVIGMLTAFYALPREYENWTGLRIGFELLGLSVALLAYGLAIILIKLTIEDWVEYRERLNIFTEIIADTMRDNGGLEIERTTIASELTTSEPLHMLGVALSVHRRVMCGELTPYSVRQLQGPVMLDGTRLGDISSLHLASEMSKRLADIGLIEGRGDKSAGKWTAENEQKVIEKWAKNIRKST